MFYNKADLKNIHSKETVMKSFFQLGHNLQLYWKRTPSQLFSDDFRNTFHNTVLCQNASKSSEGLKGTEAFARSYSIKKTWSRKFHKIQPKETVIKFSF